jgi:uncharacterized protein
MTNVKMRTFKELFPAFFCGFLFSVGLGIGGMMNPAKIAGFLDIAGNWDPSLAFVMAGGAGVNFILYQIAMKRKGPIWAKAFGVPHNRVVDKKLIAGAALFGLGWGLGGLCPGPALGSITYGHTTIYIFLLCMIVGNLTFKFFHQRK